MRINYTFDDDFDALYKSYANCERGLELLRIEGIAPDNLDVGQMSKRYFTSNAPDMSIDGNANANEDLSVNNMAAEVSKGILKANGHYLLHHYAKKRFGVERANELLQAIWDGDVYFHDSSGPAIQQPYCFSYSTAIIMIEGRPYGQLPSLPPKRSDSFIAQCIETTMDLSQDFAGAITPADMLVNYSWYAKRENLSEYDMINDLQKFVHVINNKFRMGAQSPFVNISLFDRPNLQKVFGDYRFPDGSEVDFDFVEKVQTLFGEWFAKGSPDGLPYRFPVVTLNITKDDDGEIIDYRFFKWACKKNLDKGVFNFYVNDGQKLASCCRLVNDASRMQFRTDSFGNGGLNIGSHRVVTVNLPRIALCENSNTQSFHSRLMWALEACRDLLIVHREEILYRRIHDGLLKFYEPLEWFSTDQLFSTIGIIGVHEMAEFGGHDVVDDSHMITPVLQAIEQFAINSSELCGYSFNVEEIPGESAAVKLAKKDRLQFENYFPPYVLLYSNQYIPLTDEATMPERIKTTGKYMDLLSGGGILHLNVKEKIPEPDTMESLIEYAVKHGVSHLAINYGFGICEEGHVSVAGNSKECPICGKPIGEWLTRIIGYFTKTSSWNEMRREADFPERKFDAL